MEQYIMQQKALHFSDTDTARKIMASSNPVEQKSLGREVANFDISVWRNDVVKTVLVQGLRAKFHQNKHCRDFLKATGDKSIGEASDDTFWGIGMRLNDKDLWDEGKWSNNLLGKSLMEIRGEL